MLRMNLTTCHYFSEPSGGASGQATDIAIHAKEILRIREVLTGIYQRHCGKPTESAEQGFERFRMHLSLFFPVELTGLTISHSFIVL